LEVVGGPDSCSVGQRNRGQPAARMANPLACCSTGPPRRYDRRTSPRSGGQALGRATRIRPRSLVPKSCRFSPVAFASVSGEAPRRPAVPEPHVFGRGNRLVEAVVTAAAPHEPRLIGGRRNATGPDPQSSIARCRVAPCGASPSQRSSFGL